MYQIEGPPTSRCFVVPHLVMFDLLIGSWLMQMTYTLEAAKVL
jgi:hypothetical protein